MQYDAQKKSAGPATFWNRSYIIVFLTGISTAMSSYMTTPIISKFALSLGSSLTAAGSIASIMSIAALICRPFSGAVSDMFNRKRVMIASMLVAALTIGTCAFTRNMVALVILRIIHGFAFSFMTVANMALASSLIPEHQMGKGMGYLGLGTIIASAVGPGLGLAISDKFGFSACFVVSMLFLLLGAAAIMMVPYQHIRVHRKGKRLIKLTDLYAGELTIYVLILAIFSSGNGLLSTYLALLGDERGIGNIALFFTAYSLVVVLIRPMAGALLDRKGLAVILYPSFLIASASMILTGAASTLGTIIIAAVLKALGQGAGSPSIQAYSIKLLGKERAGVASSTCFIGQDIGNGIAPIFGGVVATGYGYSGMFYCYAAVVLIIGPLLYSLQRFRERRAGRT